MSDTDTIRAHLDRPGRRTEALPVFAKTRLGIVKVGNATTSDEADVQGLSHGIRCEKISRATLQGDDRPFFVLR